MSEVVERLVKAANDRSSWENRLNALNEISKIDCPQRKDVVIRLALHDKVFAVKEEACRVADRLKFTKKGQKIKLGKKDIGYKNSDFTKVFKRIIRESKVESFDLKIIKDKFKIVNPEMYDVMQFEKKKNFDSWIENVYNTLPKK